MRYEWNKNLHNGEGGYLFPNHELVNNCIFLETEEKECVLLNSMAEIAEKSKMTHQELLHLFTHTLRALGSKSSWARNSE